MSKKYRCGSVFSNVFPPILLSSENSVRCSYDDDRDGTPHRGASVCGRIFQLKVLKGRTGDFTERRASRQKEVIARLRVLLQSTSHDNRDEHVGAEKRAIFRIPKDCRFRVFSVEFIERLV